MLFAGMVSLNAQTVFDYETPETTIPFQFFGGDQEGVILDPVDNPNPSGINTSATVYPFTELPNGPDWAGGFSNPDPVGGINATNGGQVCIDVHFSEANTLTVKLENGNGDDNWEQTVQNDVVGEWTTMCFDLSVAGEGNGVMAVGKMYTRIVLFHGLGEAAPAEQVIYVDNFQFPEGGGTAPTSQVVFDFETLANFTYFGSTLDGTQTTNISNPNATGINESATVLEYIKAANSEVWAGAFADPAPSQPINATNGGTICVDVHYDHIGNIAIKLEGGPEGTNWVQTVENTVMNQWEQVCVDLSMPGLEDSMNPATGNVYTQIVIFPDFGTAFDADVVSYLDNIIFTPSTEEVEDAEVTFSLDMNSYTDGFTTPFVIGTFNNFDGEANPLSDDDGDGVWTTTIEMPNGSYEYLYTVDNTVTEMFDRTSECTTTFDNGDGDVFTNRLVAITGNVELPTTCFNSCYACGEEVNLTVNVSVTDPSEDGVWLAGGLDFGAAGGEFRMNDDDGDGIFSISIVRYIGYEGFYTFTNGNCPDYSCKENIEGQECADPDNFNDRFIDPLTADVTIDACFEDCSCITSTNDLEANNDLIKLYPTIAQDRMYLDVLTSFSNGTVQIISLQGELMNTIQIGNNTTGNAINVANYPQGTYMLSLTTDTFRSTQRFVKM